MIKSYSNYEWFLKQDFHKYAGEWLAIINKQVIAHNKSAEEVIKISKTKYPREKPFITKVRDKLSIL